MATLEAFKKNDQKQLVAFMYHSIGNLELRDDYIEESLKTDCSESNILYLRRMQDKLNLVPTKIINKHIASCKKYKDWTELARFYLDLKDYTNASKYYLKGIMRALEQNRLFTAAFYLKEASEARLDEYLFIMSYQKARKDGDLHRHIRALEELGWKKELKKLLISKKDYINNKGDLFLKKDLAWAMADTELYAKLQYEIDKKTSWKPGYIHIDIE